MTYNIYNSKKVFTAVVIIAIISSAFLHLWRLGFIPNGFFYDESSIGYNAYCILETGADEYGTKLPVFFRGFDNYHDPVMVYFLVPIIKCFGLSEWAIRLPSALFLLFASFAFYFLSFEYLHDKWLSVLSSFIFSLLPWTFPVSRANFAGYTPMLMGIIGGWYFIIKMFKYKRFSYAFISALSWSFAMYSHNCGRPVSVVLIVCAYLSFHRYLKREIKSSLFFISCLLIFMLPILIAYLNNPSCLMSRFSEISLYSQSKSLTSFAYQVIVRYVEYFSPYFLFITGDANLRHATGASGVLYVFLIPFCLAGIFYSLKCSWKNPKYALLLSGLLVYPVAAVLTKDHMHSTRCINGAPFWCLTAFCGIIWIKQRFHNSVFCKSLIFVVILFGLIEIFAYFKHYFREYVKESRPSFDAPLTESIKKAFTLLDKNETLYVSSSVFPHPVNRDFKPVWYSHFLFFGRFPPKHYQEKGLDGAFIMPYEGLTKKNGLILRLNSKFSVDKKGNIIIIENDEPLPVNSKLVYKIPLAESSDRFFEIYRLHE